MMPKTLPTRVPIPARSAEAFFRNWDTPADPRASCARLASWSSTTPAPVASFPNSAVLELMTDSAEPISAYTCGRTASATLENAPVSGKMFFPVASTTTFRFFHSREMSCTVGAAAAPNATTAAVAGISTAPTSAMPSTSRCSAPIEAAPPNRATRRFMMPHRPNQPRPARPAASPEF